LAPPEESPTTPVRALRPPLEPKTIVLLLEGPIARADVTSLCERVRVLLQWCDADLVVCDVGAIVEPDAVTVDVLARLQLTARRLGRQVRLRDACGELRDLLALVGLGEVVLCAGSAVEPRGETKEREQAGRVEEEADPADPAG
jgi:ABC-type transporter Mla MlaB component